MSKEVDIKVRLRARMRTAIRALDTGWREKADASIADLVVTTPEWRAADDVLLYSALADEVGTSRLLAAALESGKRLFLPRVGDGGMDFRAVRDAAELGAIPTHRWGMREPRVQAETWTPAGARALLICPGRAFDRAGARLGRGGGYYDRFLARLGASRARGARTGPPARPGSPAADLHVIGICYELQLVPWIASSRTDEPVDAVVTERRVVRFSLKRE